MAKRLTDTEKWKKPFVRGLDAPYKLLWFYILDDCDHAGIWQVDEDVAKIRVDKSIDFEIAKELFKEQIQVIDNGDKWFIFDFVEFQYGVLNPDNRVHKSELIKKDLNNFAPGNEEKQILILEQSIKNNWAGVFPLKQNEEPKTQSYLKEF
jgi:hypothetical protein